MKKIENYKIEIIIPKNKISVDALQNILYEVNELIFFFKQSFATYGIADLLIENFKKKLKALEEIDINGDAVNKKEEIEKILREYIKNLSVIKSERHSEDEIERAEQTMQKYLVAQYIKLKKMNMTVDQIVTLLKRNRLLADTLCTKYLKSFSDMQNELLEMIYKKFDLSINDKISANKIKYL